MFHIKSDSTIYSFCEANSPAKPSTTELRDTTEVTWTTK